MSYRFPATPGCAETSAASMGAATFHQDGTHAGVGEGQAAHARDADFYARVQASDLVVAKLAHAEVAHSPGQLGEEFCRRNLLRLFGTTLFLLTLCLGLSVVVQSEENLDEMFNRKARAAAANWSPESLEGTNGVWQPEALTYKDVTIGHEVWRMTQTPGLPSIYHDDIAINPWSADGRRLSFSSPRPTNAYDNYDSWSGRYNRIFLVVDVNGAHLRPPVNSPRRVTGHYPLFWSPQIPDVFYDMGEDHYMDSNGVPGTLYKVTVTDTGESRQELVANIPFRMGGSLLQLVSISPDGKMVMVKDDARPLAGDSVNLFPTIIVPDGSARTLVPNGYPYFRDPTMAEHVDTPSFFDHAHGDTYRLMGAGGQWFFTVPAGSHCHWKFMATGSAMDGGPRYPGEIEPVYGCTPNPYGVPYMSHIAIDNWGRHTIFSSVDVSPIGPGTWDLQNQAWVVETFGGSAQHHDWHGFSDWTVSSRGAGGDSNCSVPTFETPSNYSSDRLYTQLFDQPGSQYTTCYTHTLFNNGGCYVGSNYEYNSLPRPAQSPDGTKIAFHSSFLNPKTGPYDNNPDIFWVVAFYPFPPTQLEARSGGGGVELEFLPPKYTNRPWATGEELFAREIKQYHVWRAPAENGPWVEVGVVPAYYNNDRATNTLKPITQQYTENWVNALNKITYVDHPVDNTWYYALTSEEHSGLESDGLLEVLQVEVRGGGVSGIPQLTRYDFDLARKIDNRQKRFWTAPPQAPALTVTAGSASGQNRLSWVETSDSKVRYYNIYYSSSAPPAADQQHRIASPPVGTTTYLDWLADGTMPGYYRITSVDRQGNEGTSPTSVSLPTAPAGLGLK